MNKRNQRLLKKVPNSHIIGLLKLRKDEIINFENSIPQVDKNPTSKNEIIKNFRQEAEAIKNRLDEL